MLTLTQLPYPEGNLEGEHLVVVKEFAELGCFTDNLGIVGREKDIEDLFLQQNFNKVAGIWLHLILFGKFLEANDPLQFLVEVGTADHLLIEFDFTS